MKIQAVFLSKLTEIFIKIDKQMLKFLYPRPQSHSYTKGRTYEMPPVMCIGGQFFSTLWHLDFELLVFRAEVK